jgi:hypothetical protein
MSAVLWRFILTTTGTLLAVGGGSALGFGASGCVSMVAGGDATGSSSLGGSSLGGSSLDGSSVAA